MLSSTVNNLNASFSLCDLDANNRETDASTVNNDDASANLFSDDTRSHENLYDCSSFADSVAQPSSEYYPNTTNEEDATGQPSDAPLFDCTTNEEDATGQPSDAPLFDSDSSQSTDASFDLPRPAALKKRRMNLDENIQDASVVSDIFNRTVQIDTKLVELGKNQKKGISLTVQWGGYHRIMGIAPAGVGKKAIRWRCCDRSCHGTLLTKVTSSLIQAKENGNQRKRFQLVDPDKLKLIDLDPQKETPHSCQQVLDKTVIVKRIENEARRLIEKKSQESKDSARRLAPQRVIREATKTVVDSLDQQELSRNRLNLDRFNMPRRVHRLIRAVKPTHLDITKENIATYVLPESLGEGAFKLDSQYAESTSNRMLLFTCPEIGHADFDGFQIGIKTLIG